MNRHSIYHKYKILKIGNNTYFVVFKKKFQNESNGKVNHLSKTETITLFLNHFEYKRT